MPHLPPAIFILRLSHHFNLTTTDMPYLSLNMKSFMHAILLGAFVGKAFGTIHHMFSGAFAGSTIYAIEFDDEANTLTLANSISSNSSTSKWIAIDVF